MRPLGVTLAYFQFIRALVVALIALGVYLVSGTAPVELKPAELGTAINKSARSTLGLSLSTVKMSIKRGREQFRRRFRESGATSAP